MDSASLRSLSPLLDGIDQWTELAPLLPVIVALELILSADNAVALASITKRLPSISTQKTAINLGIFISLILRIILILTAQVVMRYPMIQIAAGIYLIVLFCLKVLQSTNSVQATNDLESSVAKSKYSLVSTIFLLAITDLAFSIDSITAAIAISDQYLLVIIGAIIGVIALRFTSGLFIYWLEIFSRLELAGYIAVGFVGLKLLLTITIPRLYISELFVFTFMIVLFSWGFSKKKDEPRNSHD